MTLSTRFNTRHNTTWYCQQRYKTNYLAWKLYHNRLRTSSGWKRGISLNLPNHVPSLVRCCVASLRSAGTPTCDSLIRTSSCSGSGAASQNNADR
jgi:hypothetical protein